MSLAAMGRDSEAQEEMKIVHQLEPTWTRQHVEDLWRLQFRKPEAAEILITLIRGAWKD